MSAGRADRNPPPGDFLRYAALVTTICEGGPDTPSNLDALLVRLLPWRAFLSSSSQIGNLWVIQSLASASFWNPLISSKAPSPGAHSPGLRLAMRGMSDLKRWKRILHVVLSDGAVPVFLTAGRACA
jgi:hypothetical protein